MDNNKIASHQSADHIILGTNSDEQNSHQNFKEKNPPHVTIIFSLHFLMETNEQSFVSLYGIYSSILMAFTHICWIINSFWRFFFLKNRLFHNIQKGFSFCFTKKFYSRKVFFLRFIGISTNIVICADAHQHITTALMSLKYKYSGWFRNWGSTRFLF